MVEEQITNGLGIGAPALTSSNAPSAPLIWAFVEGTDHQLYYATQTPGTQTWQGWTALGGNLR
jgi:hypothetical protein